MTRKRKEESYGIHPTIKNASQGFASWAFCRFLGKMSIIQSILRRFGYLKVDYGFACGRHWMSIDDKVIAQTSGDDVWLKDEDIHRLGYIICDKGKYWTKPEKPEKPENIK